jgi:hypothetical protein
VVSVAIHKLPAQRRWSGLTLGWAASILARCDEDLFSFRSVSVRKQQEGSYLLFGSALIFSSARSRCETFPVHKFWTSKLLPFVLARLLH